LVEISLAEGRALLDDALAEGKRFSRPAPRDYKLAQSLMQTRIFDATPPAESARTYVNPELKPEELVQAYVAALHYRDYLLVYELLAREHAVPGATTPRDGAEALRQEYKHAPRRREGVRIESQAAGKSGASVEAAGEEERVEPNGHRTRQTVRERYTLTRTPDGWRIAAVERR
jgi:hypothetical protein